jgi:hypothetical protein
MPIEIKELHIKTVVDNKKTGGRREVSPAAKPETVKAIVAQCVEQVMDILNQKAER